jgi:membrane-associated protein
MSHLKDLIDYFLHLDQYLQIFANHYGHYVYLILFLTIFCETGLVITPFLPGDSLLFAAGSLAALGQMNVHLLVGLLILAALLGDNLNYAFGKVLGTKLFHQSSSRLFNPDYLHKTHLFYQKYGVKTIILARFIPILRTYAPFVAGLGTMRYRTFMLYNIIGGILWITSLVYGSYFFGNLPIVKNNFSIVIVCIIMISISPPLIVFLKGHFIKKRLSGRDSR